MNFPGKKKFYFRTTWQNKSIKIMGGLGMLCIFSAAKDKFREDYQKQRQTGQKQDAKRTAAVKK
ncbi:hypothetical protein CHH53_02150 [Terribacillus sp. 7520-G]|nr:hypothetical protein CHH53_02150 [Terribacillus sp. 7520-G]